MLSDCTVLQDYKDCTACFTHSLSLFYWIDWSSDFRRPSPSNNRQTAGLATWTDLAVVTVVLLLNATVIKMLGITITFIYPSWKQNELLRACMAGHTASLQCAGLSKPSQTLLTYRPCLHPVPLLVVGSLTTQQRYHLPLGSIRAVHSAAQRCPQQLFPIYKVRGFLTSC